MNYMTASITKARERTHRAACATIGDFVCGGVFKEQVFVFCRSKVVCIPLVFDGVLSQTGSLVAANKVDGIKSEDAIG